MDKDKSDLKVHVFVCTNKKNGKTCCADKNAEELRSSLKDWSRENPDWRKRIRINASGCLDRCKDGIAIAIYPQNIWLTHVESQDIDKVKSVITELMDAGDNGSN